MAHGFVCALRCFIFLFASSIPCSQLLLYFYQQSLVWSSTFQCAPHVAFRYSSSYPSSLHSSAVHARAIWSSTSLLVFLIQISPTSFHQKFASAFFFPILLFFPSPLPLSIVCTQTHFCFRGYFLDHSAHQILVYLAISNRIMSHQREASMCTKRASAIKLVWQKCVDVNAIIKKRYL